MELPKDFTSEAIGTMDNDAWQRLLKALTLEPTISIRVNPFKFKKGRLNSSLVDKKVPWSLNGYYLKKRPNFTLDPLLHSGLYYVQEASSMFLSYVLRRLIKTKEPITMLDVCASPGGKSLAALEALPKGSLLVANEPIEKRAKILKENLLKFGHPNVIVTSNYPKDFLLSGLTFDVILVDAPCSGEGMFRKDEVAIKEWSKKNVTTSCLLQREIISQAWACLKPGGFLIYSTCTFNTKENEENVLYIKETLEGEIIPIKVEKSWNIHGSLLKGFKEPVYRFLPGFTRGEGLFMAVAKKKDEAIATKTNKFSYCSKQKKDNPKQKDWLLYPEDYDVILEKEHLIAIPLQWENFYTEIKKKKIKCLLWGIDLALKKGEDFLPLHTLAMSIELNPNAFPSIEVDYAQAISFLRREALNIKTQKEKGYILITYKGYALGFGKNIGTRINNLYPTEYKILTSHLNKEYIDIFEN